jgi:hypothetical protein
MFASLQKEGKTEKESGKQKPVLNKYFVEDEPILESKFDREQRRRNSKEKFKEKLNFNQIDDDEPERSSDDEFEGKESNHRSETSFLDLLKGEPGEGHRQRHLH